MNTITLHGHKNLFAIAKKKVMEIVLPRKINSVKVVRIKRQLANGSYELDEKLDYVLDDILKDVNA
jgi:anti-sigma28 factor (negative regulator of flagellin synthesis)